jgi:hypothetical protein
MNFQIDINMDIQEQLNIADENYSDIRLEFFQIYERAVSIGDMILQLAVHTRSKYGK